MDRSNCGFAKETPMPRRLSPFALLSAAFLAIPAISTAQSPAPVVSKPHVKNIVLVHGAWADGSGFQGVYNILVRDGYSVSIVSNADESLSGDVAATKRVLARQNGPAILVGHSYGGVVITEAGTDPKVKALVYLAAFVPDAGESAFGLLPADGPQPPIEPTPDGMAFLNREAYIAAFAADLSKAQAAFMADSQVPVSIPAAGSAKITIPAWRSRPSWYLVSTQDQIIPPAAQRLMAGRAKATVAEVVGSHVAFISHPEAAAALIKRAAEAAAQ
jgi:pimeloyl-ACP methyl ester carboxylesterase